jgi:hypothetical protein
VKSAVKREKPKKEIAACTTMNAAGGSIGRSTTIVQPVASLRASRDLREAVDDGHRERARECGVTAMVGTPSGDRDSQRYVAVCAWGATHRLQRTAMVRTVSRERWMSYTPQVDR